MEKGLNLTSVEDLECGGNVTLSITLTEEFIVWQKKFQVNGTLPEKCLKNPAKSGIWHPAKPKECNCDVITTVESEFLLQVTLIASLALVTLATVVVSILNCCCCCKNKKQKLEE